MLDHTRKPAYQDPPARHGSNALRTGSAQDLQEMIKEIGTWLGGNPDPHQDLSSVLAASLALRYIGTQPLTPDALVELVSALRTALDKPLMHKGPDNRPKTPAVPVAQSVTPDYILCLEDGHACKSLQRYLKHKFRLSPQAYRLKWGLPADYPMVSENYSRRRAELARANQLGRYQRDKDKA